MVRILVVEDDVNTRKLMQAVLSQNGYEPVPAADGVEALDILDKKHIDLILLDIMMPRMDGYEFTEIIRGNQMLRDIPILMVTARQEDIDKIRGLGLGADDYIEKPFSPSVLVARVKAHLARYRRLTKAEHKGSEIQIGGIRLNEETHRVYVEGEEVELTHKEYELLLFFMLNVDVVFSREQLYERIWGWDAMGDSATVAVHINRLRKKIEKDPANPRYIVSVWGAGYRFNAC